MSFDRAVAVVSVGERRGPWRAATLLSLCGGVREDAMAARDARRAGGEEESPSGRVKVR